MKILILRFHIIFIVIFVNQNICIGQTTYHPFPESNAVWSVLDFTQYYPNSLKYQTIHYTLEGDTIISNTSYRKLFSNKVDSVILTTSINTLFEGALRQDTALKKVFFVPKDSINEILLYDFDINIGDTVNIKHYTGNSFSHVCYATGYQLFDDGISRKYYTMFVEHTSTWDAWYEGIGSYRGLLNNYKYLKWYNHTLCFYQNNTLVFQLDSLLFWDYPYCDSSVVFSGCHHNNLFVQVPPNTFHQHIISVYPNPLTEKSLILIPPQYLTQNLSVKIFDIRGRKVLQFNDLKEHEIELRRSDFKSAGLYFAVIRNDKNFETLKLLVY